ncbi:hypothetical protein PHMEG_00010787 [Phytophthora megakarya]|uniref:Uncharacterized protein n=1 Tax=Phytophthora megakarya TaxID=4795 RepID=A0A225WCU3_9STRA|nr:hypothetical protein PHMEG_00010787 [Phytophthora megakarya]
MERGDATRSSRWLQGLSPSEQRSLEEVERDRRKKIAATNVATNTAKRRAAEEEKLGTQGETASESLVQNDAHQVSPDDEDVRPEGSYVDDSAPSGSVLSPDGEGESVLEKPVQTTVVDIVKVKPPVGYRVSDFLQTGRRSGSCGEVRIRSR